MKYIIDDTQWESIPLAIRDVAHQAQKANSAAFHYRRYAVAIQLALNEVLYNNGTMGYYDAIEKARQNTMKVLEEIDSDEESGLCSMKKIVADIMSRVNKIAEVNARCAASKNKNKNSKQKTAKRSK